MQYYIVVENEAAGPYELMTLVNMIEKGQVGVETLTWREGMENWAPAKSFDELINYFPASISNSVLQDDSIIQISEDKNDLKRTIEEGGELQYKEEALCCPRCATKVPKNSAFCSNCGMALENVDPIRMAYSFSFHQHEMARIMVLVSGGIMGLGLCLPWVSAWGYSKALIEGDGILIALFILPALFLALRRKRIACFVLTIIISGFTVFEIFHFMKSRAEVAFGELLSFQIGFYLYVFGNVVMLVSAFVMLVSKRGTLVGKDSVGTVSESNNARLHEKDSKEKSKIEKKVHQILTNISSGSMKKKLVFGFIILVGVFVIAGGVVAFFEFIYVTSDEKQSIEYVIDEIDDIGKVTVISGEQIKKANEAYNELSEKCKRRIKNYNTLIEATSQYDDLCVSNAERLINEISPEQNVSWKNLEEIQNARLYIVSLTSEQRKKVSNLELLEKYEDIVQPLKNASDLALDFMDGLALPNYSIVEKSFYDVDELLNNSYFQEIYLPTIKKNMSSGLSIDVHKMINNYTKYDGAKGYDDLLSSQKSKIDSLSKAFLKRYLNSYLVEDVKYEGETIIVKIKVHTIAKDYYEVELQKIAALALEKYIEANESDLQIMALAGRETALDYLDSMYYLSIIDNAMEITQVYIDECSLEYQYLYLKMEEIDNKLMVTDIVGF